VKALALQAVFDRSHFLITHIYAQHNVRRCICTSARLSVCPSVRRYISCPYLWHVSTMHVLRSILGVVVST